MASSIFIKFDGVEGESTDEKHKGEIEIESWNHSFRAPSTPVRSTAGSAQVARADHSSFTFSRGSDKASTALAKACWTGKHFTSVIITAYRDTGEGKRQNYHVITLTDVVIENISIGASYELPSETISLNYGTIEYAYKQTDLKTGDAKGVDPAYASLIENKQKK